MYKSRRRSFCVSGKKLKKPVRAYRQFIADGVSAGRRGELVGGGLKRSLSNCVEEKEWGSFDERILGSGEFVDSLQQHELLRDRIISTLSLPELVSWVAASFGLPVETIIRHGKAKPVSEARGLVAYLAIREFGFKGIEVGKELHLTSSGVSLALRRGESLVRCKPELRKVLG